MLGKTYYPAGKVDPFWLNIALGDTVSYEQVQISCDLFASHFVYDPDSLPFCYSHFCSPSPILMFSRQSGFASSFVLPTLVAYDLLSPMQNTLLQVCTSVLAHMIPDYLSPERQQARAPLTKAITGVSKSIKIANFCRRCLAAEDTRPQAVARSDLKRLFMTLPARKVMQGLCTEAQKRPPSNAWLFVLQCAPVHLSVCLRPLDRYIMSCNVTLRVLKPRCCAWH